MFERADALLDEALAGGDLRRCNAAVNFVLRTDRRARDRGWTYNADILRFSAGAQPSISAADRLHSFTAEP